MIWEWISHFFKALRGHRALRQPFTWKTPYYSASAATWWVRNKDRIQLRNAAITRARVEAFHAWPEEKRLERIAYYKQKILAERGQTQ